VFVKKKKKKKKKNKFILFIIFLFKVPLFGGFFVDKLGIRLGNLVFTGVLVIGQLFCTLAPSMAGGWDSKACFGLILTGRAIFALGGENLSVT
jgi:hypothetical protein